MAESAVNLQKAGTYNTVSGEKAARSAAEETRKVISELGESIKTGAFAPAYLLYGPEGYLVRYYKNALKKAMVGDDDMNCTVISSGSFDTDEFFETARTMPFFAPYRLIIVENSGIFQAGAGGGAKPEAQKLCELLPQLPDTTRVIFAESGADRRFALFKSFSKIGKVCQFSYMDHDWIVRWICARARSCGALMEQRAADMLLSRVGSDLNLLSNEIDKLVDYPGGSGQIKPADIEAVSSVRLEDRIFDMLSAALGGRMEKAMRMYEDLLGLREAPIKMIVIMGRQCAQILAVKNTPKDSMSDQELASAVGVSAGSLYYIRRDNLRVSDEKLEMGVRLAAELDQAVKSGKIEDRLAAEILIARLGERG